MTWRTPGLGYALSSGARLRQVDLWSPSRQRGHRSQPSSVEVVAVLLQEDGEADLARAVARSHTFDLESVVERVGDAADLAIRGEDEMGASRHEIELRIDLRSLTEDLLHPRVRTAHHHDESLGVRIARESSFMSTVPAFSGLVVRRKKPG